MAISLRVFTEPQQGADYETLLRVAKAAEDLGFDGFFRSDHYMKIEMGNADGLPGPTDSWVTLAGLARETSRIRIGTLMSAATFRHPGPLALQVAQVDAMSGGRVEFGIGSGWFEPEHRAYSIPFPSLNERFERYAEQLEAITGLWTTPLDSTYSFKGRHYEFTDAPALPKPVQTPHPPVIIGGNGAVKTPRLAARYAGEFNTAFRSPEDARPQIDRVRVAVTAAGRVPDSMVFSVALTSVVGADDAEVARRADAVGLDSAQLRANGLAGTPDEVADRIGQYAELGVSRVYVQVLDLSDLDHLELIASRVAPQVA